MAILSIASAALVLLAASPALARTDIAGCTYYDSVVVVNHVPSYNTRIWYVPGSGELCELLDCGGGRAPPKTTVPGCPQYVGTATYSPKFIDPKTLGGAPPAKTTTAAETETESPEAPLTTTPPALTSSPGSSSVVETETETDGTVSGTSAETSTETSAADTRVTTMATSTGIQSNATGSASSTSSGSPKTTSSGSGAVPTAAAVLGSCLVAGIAACVGMM